MSMTSSERIQYKTREPQEPQAEKWKNIHDGTITTPNNNYYNNYNKNTEPGVFVLSSTDAARICKAYSDGIGQINGIVAHMIESFLQQGLTVDDIIMAIEETAFAPRPSAAYLRAILRNWVRDGRIVARARFAAERDKPCDWWRAKTVHTEDDLIEYPW